MFRLSTVEPATYATLKAVFEIPEIKKSFALAGGTSLALQLGHHHSIDLDIFSHQVFSTKELELLLASSNTLNFEFVNSNKNMLFCYLNKIKCDFVFEPSKQLQPFIENDGVNYFHLEDIAGMKMHTVCGRGKRKDFFDIYVLIENFGWKEMLIWFEKKYDESQLYFLWRSITYFNDADDDVDITCFEPYTKSWEEIKEFISKNCV